MGLGLGMGCGCGCGCGIGTAVLGVATIFVGGLWPVVVASAENCADELEVVAGYFEPW